MGYRIGSFNCLNFGSGASGLSKDTDAFADIISRGRFDIIALQEIRNQNALDFILKKLPGWKGAVDNTANVNDYAFLWNPKRVTLANVEALKSDRVYQPRVYQQYRIDKKACQQDLRRDPFFARFFPVVDAPWVEFRIINSHIRFSKGASDSSEDEQTPGAIAMRRNEFDVLTRAIYAKEADKRYGTFRPAYVILLGDYNLNHSAALISPALNSPGKDRESIIIPGRSGRPEDAKQIITVQSELTTLQRPNDDQEVIGFASNYDHFTYDANRFAGVFVHCKRMDDAASQYRDGLTGYRKKVSDHVPIILDLEFR